MQALLRRGGVSLCSSVKTFAHSALKLDCPALITVVRLAGQDRIRPSAKVPANRQLQHTAKTRRTPNLHASVFDDLREVRGQYRFHMSTESLHLTGLIAAPHTPMKPDFNLNLSVVPRQIEILITNGVKGAFICGSTGESHSLTVAERIQVAEAWKQAIGSKPLKLIVHAGHNCLQDARTLAAHAQSIRADALAITSPSYFKPTTVEDLVDFCTPIAAAARELPFYFYDIPMLTGVNLPMAEFLRQAPTKIPNLAGLKFTNPNLVALQQCLACDNGPFNILYGLDELLLTALTLGVVGAVGSTYNFAAPLYQQIIAAHEAGDLATAQALQLKSVKLVDTLLPYGVLAAGKALMSQLGADCGPVRPPLRRLTEDAKARLFKEVAELGVLGQSVA